MAQLSLERAMSQKQLRIADAREAQRRTAETGEVGWMTRERAEEVYAATPAWRDIPPGRSAHVGGGLWRTVCSSCPYSLEHWGAMPQYATTGPHEVSEHGAQVAGINVGILP